MKFFKLITGSVFLRQNAILFIGAVVVGLLNYLFYPVIGRLLDPTSFGELQAIFSLFLQLLIFLSAMSVVVVFVVTNYKNQRQASTTVLELEKATVWVALAVLIGVTLFGEWLRDFFKFESATPFIILGVLLAISVPLAFRTAYLRGKQSFKASVVANLISAGGKFLFAVPLVLIGMSASGALAGVVIGQVVALGYAAWRAKRLGLARPMSLSIWSRPNVKKVWPEVKYSLFVLVGSLAVTLLLTLDTLVVKHLFDTHTAGLYAGVATVARTIFFLAVPIVMALLPTIKISAKAVDNRSRLLKSLVLFLVISLPLTLAMVCFPRQVTTVLMGAQYAEVYNLLPLLAVTTFLTSLLNVVVSYFLALKRYISGLLVIIGLAATFGLIFFRHGSPQAIVEDLLIGSMVSMCLIAVWVFARERLTSRRSSDETTTTIHRDSGTQRS